MAARDSQFMQLALNLAEQAAREGEVPVGAIVVVQGQMMGWACNDRQQSHDVLGHAELIALRMACKTLNSWRLPPRSTLYVTLEPCCMCAGALTQARLDRLVFGCRDAKAGGVRSLFALADDPRLTHRIHVEEGLLAQECQTIIQRFFTNLR
jgi:tRNA(adenine34) deaminase